MVPQLSPIVLGNTLARSISSTGPKMDDVPNLRGNAVLFCFVMISILPSITNIHQLLKVVSGWIICLNQLTPLGLFVSQKSTKIKSILWEPSFGGIQNSKQELLRYECGSPQLCDHSFGRSPADVYLMLNLMCPM